MSGGRNARQRRAACLTPASRDERAPQTTFGRRPLGTNSSTRFASCQTIAQPRRKQEPAAHRPALIRVVRSSDQFNHGDRCCSPRESRHRVLPLANLGSFRSWTVGPPVLSAGVVRGRTRGCVSPRAAASPPARHRVSVAGAGCMEKLGGCVTSTACSGPSVRQPSTPAAAQPLVPRAFRRRS
jgi:hypothetical protein